MSPRDGFKGFSWQALRTFGVQRSGQIVTVPYFTLTGRTYRVKAFALKPRPGKPRSWWLGDRCEQIPYGLETLALGGKRVFLTEGESDAWALRCANPRVPVLGLPGASSWKSKWALAVDGFSAVYAIFDGDQAGDALYDAVGESIPRLRVVTPIRGRDTRDLLTRYGVRVFREMIRVADEDYARRVGHDDLAATNVTFAPERSTPVLRTSS